MLIEQIIDFVLKGPLLLGHTKCFKTWYVHDKIKISQANLQVNYNSQIKILHLRGNVPCFLENIPGGNVLYKI